MRTFVIELRVDYDDEEHYNVITDAVKMAAKHMLTTSALIAGKRPPQIKVECGDMFIGNNEINLAEDIE